MDPPDESTQIKLRSQLLELLNVFSRQLVGPHKVAAIRFHHFEKAYWPSRDPETYPDRLQEFKRKTFTEIDSEWRDKIIKLIPDFEKALYRLSHYEKNDAPMVEKTLEFLVEQGTQRALKADAQLKESALALERSKAIKAAQECASQLCQLSPPPPGKGTVAPPQAQAPEPNKPADSGSRREGKRFPQYDPLWWEGKDSLNFEETEGCLGIGPTWRKELTALGVLIKRGKHRITTKSIVAYIEGKNTARKRQ